MSIVTSVFADRICMLNMNTKKARCAAPYERACTRGLVEGCSLKWSLASGKIQIRELRHSALYASVRSIEDRLKFLSPRPELGFHPFSWVGLR